VYRWPDAEDGDQPLQVIGENPYVIPGEKDGAPRADHEGTRIHDLRHSFASVGAGASLGLPIIGKLLGHSLGATTHRYAHLDADPMHKAVNTIGASLSAA
jgi:integrase